MLLLDLINKYGSLVQLSFEKLDDDDFVDKMSRKFSAIMMIIFATLLSMYQYVGEPIKCWCMPEYSGTRCNYAKTYCYITSFYVPATNTTSLPNREDLHSHRILYYIWVPFIFLFQAFLFFLPSLIWRMLNTKSGYDINNYVKALRNENSDLHDSRAVKYVAGHIKTCIDFRNNYEHRGFIARAINLQFFNNRFFLTVSYLFVKLLYAFIALVQLFVLNYWFSDEHYKIEFNLFRVLFGSHNWRLSERFPRLTLCKFQVYILTDQQTHWIQCALPINIYIEKIYIIIWCWLWILFLITICSFIKNLIDLIRKRQLLNEIYGTDLKSNLESYLGFDGFLILKLVKSNTNNFYISSILSHLNKSFDKSN